MATTMAVKERPILFRGEMVRAILNGTKTQTRRAFKAAYSGTSKAACPGCGKMSCPYGNVGDRLWVRETWCPRDDVDPEVDREKAIRYAIYRATHGERGDEWHSYGPWKPSIFMPRWACRIELEITDARVERLQDVSEADAVAEGFDVKLCGEVLRKAAGRASMKFGRWLELPNGDEPDGDWCVDCVESEAKSRGARVCGWNDCFDSDSAPYCQKCGHLLYHSLTRYGIETELGLTDEDSARIRYTPVGSESALVLSELAGGMGDWSDEYAGRLAQVGFGTLWESINGGGSWAANPWVWALTFRVIKGARP